MQVVKIILWLSVNQRRYGDGAGNTVEENSSVFSLKLVAHGRPSGRPVLTVVETVNILVTILTAVKSGHMSGGDRQSANLT